MSIKKITQPKHYQAGFTTPTKQKIWPKGLSVKIITEISQFKKEPQWLLDFRLKAFKYFQKSKEPTWADLKYPPIEYQNLSYFAVSEKNPFTGKSFDDESNEVDPEILKTFQKLGIPLEEQKRLTGQKQVAVDAVFDSVSVKTTFQKELKKHGIIFCPFSEAVAKHPELIQKYLASVVPFSDNFFASLNSAVFSDGTFVYIPQNVRCPMELSTYFRMNAKGVGQFERTLIVAEKNSYVSYLEGCTAPMRDENQLHAAVVEIVAFEGSEVKYSTVQNWYPGDESGKGGVYNFVTKRGLCAGKNSKISWTQLETGSSITWKYPSVILKGDKSRGEFYSLAITKNKQQADTGTKMTHLGKNTVSTIISKSIGAGESVNSYRGLVKIAQKAEGAKNFTQCDSLILSENCEMNTFPTIENNNSTAEIEHEAVTGEVSKEMLEFLQSRGLNEEEARNLIYHGFSKQILNNLPLEFAIEGKKLLEMELEGAVG